MNSKPNPKFNHLPSPIINNLKEWQRLSQCNISKKIYNQHTFNDIANEILKKWQTPHGDNNKWEQALRMLPSAENCQININDTIAITKNSQTTININQQQIKKALKLLNPWRKGPFNFFGVVVDSEWQSFYKWHRLQSYPLDWKNRDILDIGSGNGYYGWQMLEKGANSVLSIDSSMILQFQFATIKRYAAKLNHLLIPIRYQQLPTDIQHFDDVVCMGVLSHNKNPVQMLQSIKQRLKKNGRLILETLILNCEKNQILEPENRYAMMNNVYKIPSITQLKKWLLDAGFKNLNILNINQTTLDEQRQTPWMTSHSLSDFLNPHNPNQTIEGYPAPTRLMIIAIK